ncbi:MAG: hypothetical protein WC718_02545 [Phycisphaerales bacterium]|jgi:hypothetical protein
MHTHLSKSHQHTLDAILHHPTSHNLQWHDVRTLLGELATANAEANGNTTYTREGKRLVIHAERSKDVDSDAVRELRTFLTDPSDALTTPAVSSLNLLVVIDHREARVYRSEMKGTTPERVVPHDPDNNGRYLHSVTDDSNGQRRPELRSFYDAVAASLKGADHILIFGGGTGAASAMEHLVEHLKEHNKDLAAKIAGTRAVDTHHLSDNQLLAFARGAHTRDQASR